MPRPTRRPGPGILRPTALLLALAAASVLAQVGREQAAHRHGTTAITVALVDGALELELIAPGMDLVGFEHAPRDDRQEQAIEQAVATLEGSGDWLAFEPVGSCAVTSATAHGYGFGDEGDVNRHGGADHGPDHIDANPQSPDHEHDRDHGQDHDQEQEQDHDQEHGQDRGHAGGSHGEFRLKLTATCSATPQALQMDLASRFVGIEQVRVDLITDSHQDRVELSAGQTRVPLAR